MKKILILIIVVFCSGRAYCQSKDAVFVYGETGIGYGTHFALKMAVNCIFKADNIVSLCYYYNSRPAPDAPGDYRAGLLSGLPKQKLNMLGLMYGKVLYAPGCKLRYTLKAGIALGNAKTPTNYTDNGIGTYLITFGPNYNYSYHTVFNYGAVLNPTMEWPVGRGFGLGCGIFSVINPISSSVGLEGSLLFGKLRNRRAKHVVQN